MPLYNAFEKNPRKKDRMPGAGVQSLLQYPIDPTNANFMINNALVSDRICNAILDGKITETLEGAATLELDVQDETRQITNDLLADWVKMGPAPVYTVHTGKRKKKVVMPTTWNEVYCTMDGRDFALVGVEKQGEQFTLTFENRAVHELRRYNKPKVWTRTNTFTRAMAIQAMVDEVTTYPGGINFFTNELRTVQPVAKSDTTKAGTSISASQAKDEKKHGFAPNAPVTVKHVRATAQQKDYINQVLQTGAAMNMPYAVLVSSIMCITQESTVSILNNPYLGVGLFSQEEIIGGVRSSWPCMQQGGIPGDAKAYFNIALRCYKSNPSQALADLVQCVQQSGAGASYYAQWESEAKETVKLWGTSDAEVGQTATATFTQINPYNFKRGTDNAKEDSWTCIQRLAKEVQRRAFMVDNTLYYEDDNTLISSIPGCTISEDIDGIDAIDYSIDTGKAVTEVAVTAHIDAWEGRPGSVVNIEKSGPADGRWLIYQTERPLFSSIATVTLHLPQPPLPEPAPTTSQVKVSGSGYIATTAGGGATKSGNAFVDKAYDYAKMVDSKHYPYVYGGGHNPSFSPPYDCSGYVSACLHAAGGLSSPLASGPMMSWGDPGQGQRMTIWCNADHAFIEFKLPAPAGHCQANTSHSGGPSWGAAVVPWGGNGMADANSGAFTPRHYPGT